MAVSFTDNDFALETDQSKVVIFDYPLADKTLADPSLSTAMTLGEWLTFNSTTQLVRPVVIATQDNPAAVPSFPLFAQKGRSDTQSLADRNMPIIVGGFWIANTTIFDASRTVASGGPIATILQPLKVATVTIGSRNYSGLVGSTLNENVPIVGYVHRLPASNGGRLGIISLAALRNGTT